MIHPTQSSFLLAVSSVFWAITWLVSLGFYKTFDLLSLYAIVQILFCLLYFIAAIFLDSGLKLYSYRISSHKFIFLLLVFDFCRRIVFIGLGSLWIYQRLGYTAIEVLNSRLFYRLTLLIRMVCIHLLFSIMTFLMDTLAILYLIAVQLQNRQEPQVVETKTVIELDQLFTEKRVSIDLCAICSEEMQDVVESKTCKHVFHKQCINQWISNQPTCPLCRTNFTVVVL